MRQTLGGNPVTELQNALIALGTLTVAANGLFGPRTREALRRFQWYVTHLRYRLKVPQGMPPASGTICYYPSSPVGVAGSCDSFTAAAIASWQSGNFVTTSPLVRLNVDPLSNIEKGSTFHPLSYPSAQPGEILVHDDFADAVSGTMNDQAKKADVILSITQAFRRHNVPPSGAVVPPATKSQHLVGHALDVNIVDGSTVNTAAMFNADTETDNADTFVDAVKGEGLRWGGDFSTTDPVHFDDRLDPAGEDYEMTFFFAQHCFEKHHPMRVAATRQPTDFQMKCGPNL